jgi:phosphatidylserine synthase
VLPAFAIAAVGLLMVSPIPYRNGKDLQVRRSDGSIVIAVLILTLLVAKPEVTFFLVGILYTASGPFDWYWRHRTGRSLEKLEPSEPDGVPPGTSVAEGGATGEEVSQG